MLPLAAVLAWYFGSPGVVAFLDWHVHLCWIQGVADGFSDGIGYPRWIDTPNAGYGAPIFLYYPPLSHWLGAAAALVGGSALFGLKAVTAVSIVLLFFALQQWFQRWTDHSVASVLAAAGCLGVYPLAVGLWFNMPASLMGLTMAALLLSALDQGGEGRKAAPWMQALATAGLLASHLPTALTAMPALGALWLARMVTQPREGLRAAFAMLAGALIASPYWAHAWLAADWVHLDYLRTVAPWKIEDNLLSLDGSRPTRALAESAAAFRLAAGASLLGASLAVLWLGRQGRLELRDGLLYAATLLGLFMMFEPARPLYAGVESLSWLQFGWRWLGVAGLLALVLIARAMAAKPAAPWNSVVAAASVLAASLVVVVLSASSVPSLAQLPRTQPSEALAAARICHWDTLEHRPRSMGLAWNAPARTLPTGIDVLSGRLHLLDQRIETHRRHYTVHVDFPARIQLKQLGFPAWRARLDGVSADYQIDQRGLIVIDLPSGQHQLELDFVLDRAWPRWAALVGLVLAVWLGFRARRQPRL